MWGEVRAGSGESFNHGQGRWACPSILEKCADDTRLGVNSYLSHLAQRRGGQIWPSRQIKGGEQASGGSLCSGVLQWMSSVLGTLKHTSQALAQALLCLSALCRDHTFVLYDSVAIDSPKSSTSHNESPPGRSMWVDKMYMTNSRSDIGEPCHVATGTGEKVLGTAWNSR